MKIKYRNILKCIFSLCCGVTMLTSCDDAKYDIIENGAYIKEAEKGPSSKVIISADGTTDAEISVKLSDKSNVDCVYRLEIAQDVLDSFNKQNGTNYIVIPSEGFELPEEVIIPAGEFEAKQSLIKLFPFSQDMVNSGESFALPIRLVKVNGNINTTGYTSTYVITAESIYKFSAPILNGRTPVKVDMTPGELVLNEFTVEMRFQIKNFAENQALFNGGGSGQSQVYIRLEDPIGTYNLIQIVGKETYLNAKTPFEKNKWQHLAISFDGSKYLIYINGKLDAQKEVAAGAVTFSQIEFISSGRYFPHDCLLNEARLWGKALSENQIKNNQLTVSPKADGLKAYWKFNEGTGNIFKDFTGNGYDATATGNIKWVNNILSTDPISPWK